MSSLVEEDSSYCQHKTTNFSSSRKQKCLAGKVGSSWKTESLEDEASVQAEASETYPCLSLLHVLFCTVSSVLPRGRGQRRVFEQPERAPLGLIATAQGLQYEGGG